MNDKVPPAAKNDAGMAMVVVTGSIVILLTFGLVLTSTLMFDIKPTVHKRESSQSLTAARAGLTTTVAQIRHAISNADGEMVGDMSKLPCGTHTGTATGIDKQRDYSVTVRYYTVHPSKQNAAWRDANALPCATGTSAVSAARYALIEASAELDAAQSNSDKKVEAVYTMSKFTRRYLGGVIRTTNLTPLRHRYTLPVTPDTCWEASDVRAGARIELATCDHDAPYLQRWHYRPDLHIALADSVAPDGTGGFCIDGSWRRGRINLTLQPCANVRAQKWYYNGSWTFEALEPYADQLSGHCISTDPPRRGGSYRSVVGDRLTAGRFASYSGQRMCGVMPRTDPDKKVGAGNAGWATRQFVNYGEFGRCMDVDQGLFHLRKVIVYTCQARPDVGTTWNQAFRWDSHGDRSITTSSSRETQCLRGGSREGDQAYFVPCHQVGNYGSWTVHPRSAAPELAYTIQNNYNGLCLDVAPNSNGQVWSMLVSKTCVGSDEQRWNAKQLDTTAAVNNYREK